MPDDAAFMRQAIALADASVATLEGGPFGAVIVRDGRIVGEGSNRVTTDHDPTAHAEIVAIRDACRTLSSFSLEGCVIYTSCEPCPMCLAAIYWARISGIVYGNTREDAARIGFDDDLIYREVALAMDQRSIPIRRLLAGEAMATFDAWSRTTGRIPY